MEAPHVVLDVSDIKPGGHLGVIYEQPEERVEVLIPFIEAGLKHGERIWLTLDLGLEQISQRLAVSGMNVEACLALGQLVFSPIPLSEYTEEGINNQLREETLRALADGYSGLRVALENKNSPTDFPPRFEEDFTTELNFLADYPCTVLSLYSHAGLNENRLWKLLTRHSAVVTTVNGNAMSELHPVENRPALSAQWYEEVTHIGPDLFVMLDQDLHCIYWDATTAAVTGILAGEALGRPFEELLPQLKDTLIDQAFRKVLTQGEPQSFEFEYQRAGRVYFFEISVYPIGRGISVFADEITARKQSEQTLCENQEQLDRERQRAEDLVREAQKQIEKWNTILDTLAESVVIVDAQGNPVKANLAAVRLLGLDPTRTSLEERTKRIQVRCADGCSATDREGFPSARALQGETIVGGQYRITNAQGREISVIVSAAPLYEEGRVAGAVIVWHDMTEREQFFQQAEQERQRGERLAAEVQHEAEQSKAIFSALTDLVILVDAEGKMIAANPAATHFFGEDPTRADRATLGHKMAVRNLDGQLIGLAEFPSSRALRGEVVKEGRFRVRRPEGSDAIVEISAAPIWEAGKITGAVSIWRDVTEKEQLLQQVEVERQRAEVQAQEARKQAQWLEAVINAMTDVVVIVDAEGQVIRTNPVAREVFGYDPVQADRLTVAQGIHMRHLDGRPLIREELPTYRAQHGRVVQRERYRFTDREGEEQFMTTSASPVYESEQLMGAVAVWRNVTEHEQQLQQIEIECHQAQHEAEQLNLIFSAITDVVIVMDEKGKMIAANPAAVRFFGGDPAQFDRETLGKKVKVSHLDGRPMRIEEYPASRCLKSGEPVLNEPYRIHNAEGQMLTLNFSAVPLRSGDRITGAVSVWHDITEREQLLQQVESERERAEVLALETRKQAQWLEAVINAITDVVVIVDTQGRIVQVNPAASEFFGIDFTTVDRDTLARQMQVRHLDGRPLIKGEFPSTRALNDEVVQKEHYHLTLATGEERIMTISAAPVCEGEQIIGAVMVSRDVTEQEQLIQQLDHARQISRQQADKWNAVFNSMTDAVLLYDVTGRLVSVNPEATRLYGTEDLISYSRERFIRDSRFRYPDGRLLERMEEAPSSRALQGKTVAHERFVFTNVQGKDVTVMISASPLYEDDQVIGAVAVWHDVTEREQLLQQLKEEHLRAETRAEESQQQARWLTAVLDSVIDMILIVDANGQIVHSNPAAIEFFGFDPALVDRKDLARIKKFSHLDGRPVRPEELPLSRTLKGEALQTETYRVTHEGGRGSYLSISTSAIRREGKIIGAVTAWRDVTEQEQLLQEVEQNRRLLQTLIDTIPLPVIFADSQRIVRVANSPAQQIWQHPLIGESWDTLIGALEYWDPETGGKIPPETGPLSRALRGETIQDFEVLLVQKNGNRSPILCHAAPVVMGGQVVGAILVGQDLTRLKEADRIKDQFMAMVSHDLRSPLATIQGWAMMAQESVNDPAIIQKATELILKSVQTQQRLINDLLDSAALMAGSLRVSPEVQKLQPIVELVCQGAQATGAEKGITLQWELSSEPLWAAVDSVRLQQILGNLIANAYKFTSKGGQVEIRLEREADQAVLTVQDTGRGISPDHLPHIFERFYSQAGAQPPSSRSLGLGLAIVKALVELQSGTVSAWSEGEQRGSTFTVRFPLAEDSRAVR